MLFFIPYNKPLISKPYPYVTYLIALICIIVFVVQWFNHQTIKNESQQFCHQLSLSAPISEMDVMPADKELCALMIKRLEQRNDLSTLQLLKEYFWFNELSATELKQMTVFIDKHHQQYKKSYTRDINQQLMYYPDNPNIVRMFTSVVAHADVLHLIGNLIFFIAFAAILEIYLNKPFIFIAANILFTVVGALAYSASVSLGLLAMPGLGLSAVVMGMVGMALALIPKQPLSVFVWLLFYMRRLTFSVWIVACIYIGIDLIAVLINGLDSAVNFISHLAGGLAGYVFGMMLDKLGISRRVA